MVSIPQDFSKVSFIDKNGVSFCADKKKDKVIVTSDDRKVKTESVSAFLGDLSDAEKIVSLERSPEGDVFNSKSKKGLFKELKYLNDYEKNNKLNRKNLSTINLKNDNGTDVDIKENFWGTRSFNGTIGNKEVSLKCKTPLFKKNKGKITGTINGEEVSLNYKSDAKKGMIIEGLDDKNQDVLNTIVDYAKFSTIQKTLILAMSLPGVLAGNSSDDTLIQQNLINQQNIINQQMMGMM